MAGRVAGPPPGLLYPPHRPPPERALSDPYRPEETVLSPRQREALLDAAVVAVDQELDHLASGGPREASPLWGHLPPIARAHPQAERLYRGVLVALVSVGQKLAWSDLPQPACVAEELALRHLVELAEALLELEGADHPGFEEYLDLAYQDFDHELLWDMSLDGLEDSEIGRHMGIGHLRPEEWGRPFGNTPPPHPFLGWG